MLVPCHLSDDGTALRVPSEHRMPTGIQHLSVRDKSRIREIFAKALETIMSGKGRRPQKPEHDMHSL
jgi:hypothetical protein